MKFSKKTQETHNTFPSVFDIIHKIKGYELCLKLNLQEGYYQVEVAGNDRDTTALVTQYGKYQWDWIPSGLNNPPKYFKNLITEP